MTKNNSLSLSRCLAALILSGLLINILINLYGFSSSLLDSNITPFFLAGLAFSVFCFRSKSENLIPINSKAVIPFNISLIFILPFLFIEDAFGNSDIFAIISTFKSFQVTKLAEIVVGDFLALLLENILIWVLISVSSIYLITRVNYFSYILVGITMMFVVFNPITIALSKSSNYSESENKVDLEGGFKRIVVEKMPGQKKNLVHIYLESVERSYGQVEATKESFEYFRELEQRGLSFSNIGQVYGSHFTAAGMVASQCGVPLLPNGVFDLKNKIHKKASLNYGDNEFMGGVTCLGDILKDNGYFLSYMNGSNLNIFSKGKLFLSHGYDRVFGLNTLENSNNESRQNKWGLDDSYIFEKAENEIENLAEKDMPFALTMLTIATHGPDAYLDETCDRYIVEESYIPAAIECTAKHIKSLLDKIKQLGIEKDTIVVIQSDHLAMKNTLYDQLKAQGSDGRRNYFVVLGVDGDGEINKISTQFDIYPTILEIMGFELEDRAANLGISMMSDQENLVEKYDFDRISFSLKNDKNFKDILWAIH